MLMINFILVPHGNKGLEAWKQLNALQSKLLELINCELWVTERSLEIV
jgi:hypothetical protein